MTEKITVLEDGIIRELQGEELEAFLSQRKTDLLLQTKLDKEIADREAARVSAIDKLKAIGLTESEIEALKG
jgi:hypothetical protein